MEQIEVNWRLNHSVKKAYFLKEKNELFMRIFISLFTFLLIDKFYNEDLIRLSKLSTNKPLYER